MLEKEEKLTKKNKIILFILLGLAMLFTMIFYFILYLQNHSWGFDVGFYVVHIITWLLVPVGCYVSAENFRRNSSKRKRLNVFGTVGVIVTIIWGIGSFIALYVGNIYFG